MKKRIKLIIVFVVLFAYPLYWVLTESMIRYCAYDLTQFHSSCVLFFGSGEETEFLMAMGKRSVNAIVSQIERPEVSLKTKIHLAWILSNIGEHSHFSIFIEGLHSQSQAAYYIAAVRMRDFPEECFKHFSDILDAGKKKQHGAYQPMLYNAIYKSSLDKDKKKKLDDILWNDKPFDPPFSEEKISKIKELIN